MKADTHPETGSNRSGTRQLDLFGARTTGHTYENIESVSAEIERCLKCGLCRSVCPVFAEVLDESACARGKIALIESLFEEDLSLSRIFSDRLSKCLDCKSCMDVCPALTFYCLPLHCSSDLVTDDNGPDVGSSGLYVALDYHWLVKGGESVEHRRC